MNFYLDVLNPILSSIRMYPSRNAFCFNEKYTTYEQLGQSISKVRESLERIQHESTNVGLVINDDLETYASIMSLCILIGHWNVARIFVSRWVWI